MVLPQFGGPTKRIEWFPAAATTKARFAISLPQMMLAASWPLVAALARRAISAAAWRWRVASLLSLRVRRFMVWSFGWLFFL